MPTTILPDSTRAGFVQRRATRLLTEGYRFRTLDAERLACVKPDGTIYEIDMVHGTCTCPATVRCSHLVVAERITELCARHFSHPAPDWFVVNCPECGGPAWVRGARVGGGGSVTLSVCPCGCDGRRIDSRIIWGTV